MFLFLSILCICGCQLVAFWLAQRKHRQSKDKDFEFQCRLFQTRIGAPRLPGEPVALPSELVPPVKTTKN